MSDADGGRPAIPRRGCSPSFDRAGALCDYWEGKAEAVITVESVRGLLAKLETIPPATMVQVTPVDLASFDELCMEVRQ
jgi:hypothetical protein